MSDIVVVGTVGNPGQEESATFSPLDRGDMIDVGKIIEEEIQSGYREDMVKYGIQIKRMNNGKSSK